MTPTGFGYHQNGATPPQAPVYVARVPAGVIAKDDLLRILGRILEFPEYFGRNWDALDECLSDLSWLEADDVCLLHEDLPLANLSGEAGGYLRVLLHVLSEPGKKALKIDFPKSWETTIDSILKTCR